MLGSGVHRPYRGRATTFQRRHEAPEARPETSGSARIGRPVPRDAEARRLLEGLRSRLGRGERLLSEASRDGAALDERREDSGARGVHSRDDGGRAGASSLQLGHHSLF